MKLTWFHFLSYLVFQVEHLSHPKTAVVSWHIPARGLNSVEAGSMREASSEILPPLVHPCEKNCKNKQILFYINLVEDEKKNINWLD